MNIKDLIDEFVSIKGQREALTAQASALTKKLALIEADIMEQMAGQGISKAASDKASVTMRLATHPTITDWGTFYNYVAETKQFELLHKRLSSTAFKERLAAGEAIPGTAMSESYELSVYRTNS
jgi:hypothetical protein